MKKRNLISVVIPVYNEGENIEWFFDALLSNLTNLKYEYELIYVNDGSTDETRTILNTIKQDNENIRIINFSRNFGKESAITAGVHQTAGDCVIILDGDGQHPAERIKDFVERWENGSEVVVGLRKSNKNEGFKKKYGSIIFYKILGLLGVHDVRPGITDFRLIDKKVVKSFNRLKEQDRVTRNLIDWLGYKKTFIEFDANPRIKGEATYSTKKLFELAFNSFISLSFKPLFFAGYMGAFIMLISMFFGAFVIVEKYILGDPMNLNFTGSALLAILIIFLVGILLICQGLLSVYVSHIYREVKRRPLYIIDIESSDVLA